jgi:hypothetical protein
MQLPVLATALALSLAAQEAAPPAPPKNPIPEDVVGDEHVREEFGVNEFTTPSIRKLFDMLNHVGKLKLRRPEAPLHRQDAGGPRASSPWDWAR